MKKIQTEIFRNNKTAANKRLENMKLLNAWKQKKKKDECKKKNTHNAQFVLIRMFADLFPKLDRM
jgi:hypothetical protein